MKLGSIDIGTNSIHTLIVDVDTGGSYEVLAQEKEMVRLGEGETRSHGISSRAIGDGLSALIKAKKLCDSRSVEKILAVATSAIREAPNGADFLEAVWRHTGISIEVITGHEEARLIYLAVRDSIRMDNRKALIIDIGGGSVEFIIGDRKSIYFSDSLKIGVLRLADRFAVSDPPTAAETERMAEYLRNVLKPTLAGIQQTGFDFAVASSGTALTLLGLALEESGLALESLNNVVVPMKRLRPVLERVQKLSESQRLDLKGFDPGRLRTIGPGACLLQTVFDSLKAKEVTACERAIRDGLVLDYIETNRSYLKSIADVPNPRHRSVLALARRYEWEEGHSIQAAHLAQKLFDQTASIHRLGAAERELLEYSSLLHDIGYHISAEKHHKHGYYLIKNGGLMGFTPEEIEIMACVARYHRKRKPTKRDASYRSLDDRSRKAVRVLSGVLRVADGLDRTHFSVISDLECKVSERLIEVIVQPEGDAELEVYSARQKAGLLEEALGRPLRIRTGARVEDLILEDEKLNVSIA
ncbi:MAG: Ppx/GppA family phosphatase [Armatimonadetes bacterium]|nr:Ppx/GppA family phosphatase [Armatimonadota bacterium]